MDVMVMIVWFSCVVVARRVVGEPIHVPIAPPTPGTLAKLERCA